MSGGTTQGEQSAPISAESTSLPPQSTKSPRRYRCPVCPAGVNASDHGFRQKKQLAAHQAVVHKASNLCLPCPHPGCHSLFVCESKLIAHQRKHAIRRCPDCDAEFVGYSALRRHRALEHPTPVECAQCGVKLACRALLRGHLASAHAPRLPDAPCPEHPCPYEGCGKVYTLARNLQQHVRSRHLSVRFPCPRPGCSYSLCTRQKLRLHLLLHDRGRVMPPPLPDRERQSRDRHSDKQKPSRIGLLTRDHRRTKRRQHRSRQDSTASSVDSNGAGHDSDNSLVRLVL